MSILDNDKLKLYFNEEGDQLSLVRTNWFSDFIVQSLNNDAFSGSAKVLDVGCGNGKLLNNLKHAGFANIYGCDYSAVSGKLNKSLKGYRKIDLNRESLTQIYKRESFDLVCCTEVLEHLFDPEKTIVEIIDLVKKNGYILITVPLDFNLVARIQYLFGQNPSDPFNVGTHIKFFKPNVILDKLNQYKLEIIKIKYLGIGYGILDQKIPFLSALAGVLPSLFSSDMMILLKKK